MAKFVVGHGGYVEGADTFVPDGMTVHLYADVGEGIPGTNVIEILRLKGGGRSVKTVSGKESIPNLVIKPLTQNQYELELSGVQHGEDVCFVGYDAPLDDAGTQYTLCTGFDCNQQTGVHNEQFCMGLFTELSDETEVHLLVCLDKIQNDVWTAGPERQQLPWEAPGQPDHYNRLGQLATRIVALAGWDASAQDFADYGNAQAGAEFDRLSAEDQTKLMAYPEVQQWSYVRYARGLVATFTTAEQLKQWASSQEDWVAQIYLKDKNGVGQHFRT